ncbi:hypothetical protein AQ490_16265 [Wenjunlia vitaminophila]|uniref:Uncharacterized protein n=1 Tax=Wenjunlia vitaminophila TaxID=76728 RepID=A0A0T6LX15_WENVI|nr:hypothetical protein [Wenjunlia vitaminophila]KRV50612.1 hypothetical protein AQ490_16265 [Wenjunlia vitaminophila]
MTRGTIHDLLAGAAVPPSAASGFDVGAALRRLAVDAARARRNTASTPGSRAKVMLVVVSRWVLDEPLAGPRLARLADEEPLEAEGALVFACLLHLASHPESAQFWWQLAAGAGDRVAAYCLHLHHTARGEAREAQHWFDQVVRVLVDPREPVPQPPPLPEHQQFLSLFARYGMGAEPLGADVALLAGADTCVIARRPDRETAARLHDLVGRR